MEIRQGDIYHVDLPTKGEELPDAWGSGPSGPHPVVVIQHDSRILENLNTVMVCVVTSNTDLDEIGGNVSLSQSGRANLDKDSVANVSQVLTLDKNFLGTHLGEVDPIALHDILRGVRDVLEGYRVRY